MLKIICKKVFDINDDDTHIDAEWTRYFVETYLVGIQKFLEVFICSFLLGSITETFIVVFSLSVLRNYAKGWHSSSKIGCSMQNLLYFVFIPFIIKSTQVILLPETKFVIFIVSGLSIFKYAPQGTDIEPISQKFRKPLKIKAIIAFLVLTFVSFITRETFSILIFYTFLVQTITSNPLFKNLITRGELK